MSTITKVFALFVSLLSIFLCGVVVTFMGKAENYKQRYEEQKILADAAQVVAYAAEDRLSKTVTNYGKAAELNSERLRDIRDNYNIISAELAQAQQEKIMESGKADTAIKLVSSMRDTIASMQSAQEDLWSSFDENRANMLRAQTQVTELTRQLNNELAKSSQLEDTNRRRAEQISGLEEQISKLNQQLDRYNLAQKDFDSDVAVVKTAPSMAGVPIIGEVMELDNENRVAISVGSASGVRENMRFWVVRGDKFLGNLDIIYVEADGAVGRLSNSQGVIVEGDMVTTDFN
ncbi:MAG: hypothetical protein JW745_09195 [Sedimentisphaerales bacterium]|nr:hypothetical protein [Sedimentisphaerales bacterium]